MWGTSLGGQRGGDLVCQNVIGGIADCPEWRFHRHRIGTANCQRRDRSEKRPNAWGRIRKPCRGCLDDLQQVTNLDLHHIQQAQCSNDVCNQQDVNRTPVKGLANDSRGAASYSLPRPARKSLRGSRRRTTIAPGTAAIPQIKKVATTPIAI